MRRLVPLSFCLFTALLLLSGCKRDTWYNRVFHNTTARFNGYFNARTIFNETTADIVKNHKDDFNQIIPVFVTGDAAAVSTHNNSFEQVIRKCSAVIQNHELSKWIDDSFLLIGKAYYMKAEYFEAIETFQYVYTKYKKTELAPEALVWLVRAYIDSRQYAKAQGGLDQITGDKKFPIEYNALVFALQADLLVKQKRFDQAITPLKKAIKAEKSKKVKTRYHFLLGQLTRETDRKAAAEYFRLSLKGKPYYEMEFQARMNLARLYDGNSSLRKARKQLKKLLKDDKNKDFKDEIYYEMAMLELKAKNLPLAIELLKSSAAASTKNVAQKTRTYLFLAEYYFAQPEYTKAQQYYDSTSTVMLAEHPNFREVNGKKRYLNDLVKNLEVIQLQDSLLALALLPEKQLEKIIDKAIREEERRADEARFEKEAAKNQPSPSNMNAPPGGGLAPPGQPSLWYFYNQQAVSQGFSSFRQQFGSRELADNWRRSKKQQQVTSNAGGGGTDNNVVIDLDLDPKDPRSKFKTRIPLTESAKAFAHSQIQEALFNLGNLYRDKLSDYLTASLKFETLLNRYPGCTLEPETFYRLALLYDLMNQKEKAELYRTKLLQDYPKNQFALIVKNPPKVQNENSGLVDEADSSYALVYSQYKQAKYREVLIDGQKLINSYPTSIRVPQVEFMRALSLGKTADTSMMKAALASVIGRYPSSDVSKSAQEVLDLMDPVKRKALLATGSAEALFKKSADNPHYFVMAMEMATYANNKEVEIKIANFNDSNFRNSKLKTQTMLYGKTYQFMVVREFPNSRKAMEYHTMFINNKDVLKGVAANKYYLFVVSKDNYSQLYDKNQLKEYVDFFQTDYITTQK